MNILDVIIILALCPILINGYKKGFINQALSIVALITGAWLASSFGSSLGRWMYPMFEGISGSPETIAFLGGFTIIFVLVCIIFILLDKKIEELILKVVPERVNSTLGLTFGFVNALLLFCVLFLLFQVLNSIFLFADVKGAFFAESLLFPVIESTAQTVLPNLLNAII